MATWGVGTDASGRVVDRTLGDFSETRKMFGWWGAKNQQILIAQTTEIFHFVIQMDNIYSDHLF